MSDIKCAFCKGSGIHPHEQFTCPACHGKGSVTCRGAKEECPSCDGSGYKVDGDLPCRVCGGKGVTQKGASKYGQYIG